MDGLSGLKTLLFSTKRESYSTIEKMCPVSILDALLLNIITTPDIKYKK